MTFWDSSTWHEYERLFGDEPGTRARLLASAKWQTRVIDLSLSEAELWHGVRKSYRAIIHKAEREYYVVPLGRFLRAGDSLNGPRMIHAEQAGRDTRPIETWAMMTVWMADHRGLCVMAFGPRPKDIPVGYAYFVIYSAWAYYFSAASLVENLNHALIWRTMLALKARGVRYLELGWQGEAHDEKGQHIEFYKRGFGGYDIPAKEAPALCGR